MGRLAIAGTVNDLAVSGAKPLYISLGLVIEEGLEMEILRRVAKSIAETAEEASVRIVAGDTKVVERGAADQLFIWLIRRALRRVGPRIHVRLGHRHGVDAVNA